MFSFPLFIIFSIAKNKNENLSRTNVSNFFHIVNTKKEVLRFTRPMLFEALFARVVFTLFKLIKLLELS